MLTDLQIQIALCAVTSSLSLLFNYGVAWKFFEKAYTPHSNDLIYLSALSGFALGFVLSHFACVLSMLAGYAMVPGILPISAILWLLMFKTWAFGKYAVPKVMMGVSWALDQLVDRLHRIIRTRD
jgi:hypothetical protein